MRHRGIARIEKTIKRRAACVHAPSHLHFANILLPHRLLNLPGQCFFYGDRAGLFENAFLLQEFLQ
jgi:hypothetical protein